jgi:hypothetical protein
MACTPKGTRAGLDGAFRAVYGEPFVAALIG